MTLRARDIADLCEDMAFERISITSKEGWDHSAKFILAFGPPAYRQVMEIAPSLDIDTVRAKLEAARAAPLVEAPVLASEAKSSPAVTLGTPRAKRKKTSDG